MRRTAVAVVVLVAFHAHAEGRTPLGVTPSQPVEDYPRRVSRDGMVCLQSLNEQGYVVEECQPERAPLGGKPEAKASPKELPEHLRAPPPETAQPERQTWAASTKDASARLIEADVYAARRGIVETLITLVASAIPGAVYTSSCLLGCRSEVAVLTVGATILVNGAIGSLVHDASGGEGRFWAGLLGSAIGGAIGAVAVAVALGTGSPVVAAIAVLVAGFGPTLGTLIALETDNSNRRRTLAHLAAVAPPTPPSAVVLTW